MIHRLVVLLLTVLILTPTISIPKATSSNNDTSIINLTYQTSMIINVYDPIRGRKGFVKIEGTASATLWIYEDKVRESLSIEAGKVIIRSDDKTYTYPSTDIEAYRTFTKDLDEYFNTFFSSIMYNASSNAAFKTMEYYIVFDGYGTYKGYPVYIFKLENMYMELNTNSMELKGHGSGELYLDQSFLIPVKIIVTVNLIGRFQGSLTYIFKMEDSNLPKNPPSLVVKTSKAYILCGGLPGSKITIMGSKNDDELKIKNVGDKPGYVLIIDRRMQLAPYNVLSNARGPLNKVKAVSVEPGGEKTVILWFTLDEDLSISTAGSSGIFDIAYLLIIAVFAVVVGALIYIIRRTFRRALGIEYMEETTEEPESIEEVPEIF